MVDPLRDYGLALVVENNRKNAVDVLRLALILDPAHAKLLNNLAWALVSVPDIPPYDPPQALEVIRKAISLEPEHPNGPTGTRWAWPPIAPETGRRPPRPSRSP